MTATAGLAFGEPYPWVYRDGEFVPADEARVGVLANVVSYGTGTFEGIRATWNADRADLLLLEPAAHYARMHRSARILGLPMPYPVTDLVEATAELLRRNDVRADAYVRPLLFLGEQRLFVRMHDIAATLVVAATPIPGDYISTTGVRCMVSSWRRAPDVAVPNRAKVIGSYVGPALAKTQAVSLGFDEAILLTHEGLVAEATTSNIMVRCGDEWATPPVTADILEGITLRQVRRLLSDRFGVTVRDRPIHRSELYGCDEVVLCGTAAAVVPVTEVDGRTVGDGRPGATTLALQQAFRAIARGEDPEYQHWTRPVYRIEEPV